MRMTYRFDVPAVSYQGKHYFPEDVYQEKQDDGSTNHSIEVVYYTGRWRQDTIYTSEEFIRKIQDFAIKNSKVPLIRLEAQRAKKDIRERVNQLVGDYQFKSPYHKNTKYLPFNVLGYDPANEDFPVIAFTVEYKGWTRSDIRSNYKLETIEEHIRAGKLFKKEGTHAGQLNFLNA